MKEKWKKRIDDFRDWCGREPEPNGYDITTSNLEVLIWVFLGLIPIIFVVFLMWCSLMGIY